MAVGKAALGKVEDITRANLVLQMIPSNHSVDRALVLEKPVTAKSGREFNRRWVRGRIRVPERG
jgi:hypothetical protein